MAKKKKNINSAADNRANDIVTYKILTAFVIATLAVFVLMMISSKYKVGSSFLLVNSMLMLAGIAAALVALLGFVLLIINRFADKKWLKITGCILLPTGIVVWLSCLAMYYFYINAVTMLCLLYPAVAVLYLIYLVYQPEFFAIALDAVVNAFGFYILSKLLSYTPLSYIGVLAIVGMALLNILLFVFALMARKNDGKLHFGKKVVNFAYFDHSFTFEAVTAGLFILGLLISVLVGALAAYCFLFITLAYLFVMAVYYTIKLM